LPPLAPAAAAAAAAGPFEAVGAVVLEGSLAGRVGMRDVTRASMVAWGVGVSTVPEGGGGGATVPRVVPGAAGKREDVGRGSGVGGVGTAGRVRPLAGGDGGASGEEGEGAAAGAGRSGRQTTEGRTVGAPGGTGEVDAFGRWTNRICDQVSPFDVSELSGESSMTRETRTTHLLAREHGDESCAAQWC